MIYIPMEIQLRMIIEDIKEIKNCLSLHGFYSQKSNVSVEETSPAHAPEFNNILSLSALGDLQRFGIDVDLNGIKIDL